MKRSLIAGVLVAGIAFAPAAANAGERFGDGVLGALAGAAVGGPIGAAVGGVIGFTHGPGIASEMGLRGHHCYSHCSRRTYAARGRRAER